MVAPFAVKWIVGVVVAKSALNVAVAGRYGWHIDELYYRAAGQRPALGHVDFPPIVPLLAGVAEFAFPRSLVGLRLLAVLAGAVAVVLTALIARELGGGRAAQVIAAAAPASTLLLGSNTMFQTVSFDQLMWAAVLFVAVRLLRTGDARLWPVLGVLAGLGLMTKYTIGMLLAGLAGGFVLTQTGRSRLRGRGPSVAAAIAAVVVAPNLWWQARHGWPSVDFLVDQNPGNRDEFPPHLFVPMFLLATGPLGAALLSLGWRRLQADRDLRPLAVAAGLVVAGFVASGGKPYYAAPLHLLLVAAGSVALEGARRPARRAVLAVGVVALIPAVPYYAPVLPRSAMLEIGGADVRRDYADQIGWPEVVDSVAAAYEVVPRAERDLAAILTSNYGEAGVIDLDGPARGLPPAASPHLTYRNWGPPRPDAVWLVAIGFTRFDLRRWCGAEAWTATHVPPSGVENEESGKLVATCRLRTTFGDVWRDVTTA